MSLFELKPSKIDLDRPLRLLVISTPREIRKPQRLVFLCPSELAINTTTDMHALVDNHELDAENIVRQVDFPAMRNGPLYRLMFSADVTQAQQTEIIQWYVDGLRDALRQDANTFLQVCGSDGAPVGFCGWTMEYRAQSTENPQKVPEVRQEKHTVPEALDLPVWLEVSKDLRKERERVLKGLSVVCREYTSTALTYISSPVPKA